MKRSPALTLLSRDHHHALEAALRLRRARADDLDAAVARLEKFWEPRGRRHFEIEEALILPAVPESDAEWRESCARVLEEHEAIRTGAAALSAEPDVEAAHALGALLANHVRFEERQLFVLLEERLAEDELMRLGEAVEAAHG
jgi:hypothetical protein